MKLAQPIDSHWQKIRAGDVNAFEDLVDDFKNVVTAVAYSHTGDLPGSEDVAQETFLVAWQSRDQLREPEKLAGWLCGIARNLARQWLRQQGRRVNNQAMPTDVDVEDVSPAVDQQLLSDEERQLVWRSLESMPEIYREVLILYYRQSQSLSQVAAALEITEEAAKQRLSRGRNLLRADVERTIEQALARSQPKATFTASVLALICAPDATLSLAQAAGVAGSATTAAITEAGTAVGKAAAGKTAGAAAHLISSGTVAGAAGGAVGFLGGFVGAWLGTWVPQQLAPTLTERKLLEKESRVVWRGVFAFSSVILAAVVGAILGNWPIYIGLTLTAILSFTTWSIVRGIRINRQVNLLRQTLSPEQDPNPTWLKDRLGVATDPAQSKSRWVGRQATSTIRFLGWPLFDFQVSHPCKTPGPARHARAWLAVGDKATGLIAIGGLAKGLVAIGGRAIGVVAVGGISLGLFSMGGLAAGILAIGGGALGHSAIGGISIGYQTAGGVAAGVYSANGGLALAGTVADGGLAVSTDYAVGGLAKAQEANNPLAYEQSSRTWLANYVGAQRIQVDPAGFRKTVMRANFLFIGLTLALVLPIPLLMYRRKTVEKGSGM